MKKLIKKLQELILWPWTKYQERRKWKKKLEELRKRDPFIYK
jgi:hypothetical protein